MNQRTSKQRASSLGLAAAAGTLAGAIATEIGFGAELSVAIGSFTVAALEFAFGHFAVTGKAE